VRAERVTERMHTDPFPDAGLAVRVHASLLWHTRPQRSPIPAEIRASGI
jgi:hypothetical protein